ncbi:MAG TPA: D-glycero-beta-D-manno-heptose 1-phosphate adenylyltransferase [Thermodesulfobacteriota bacterium]|nr:D-glycero-beta-D-manno-heptose 1-phosphate adenylyltransferase [Thermodesulfobacteriota bacterium]
MPINEILEKIAGKRILVAGDLMLDRYVRGTAERISPEAPVPVLKVREETSSPGGAGNVALNLLVLGARVEIAGAVGKDPEGAELVRELGANGAGTASIITITDRPTTTKTRLISGTSQIARMDRETSSPLPKKIEKQLAASIKKTISKWKPHAVIISDYDKGTVTEGLVKGILKLADKAGIFVSADPKGLDFSKYLGVDAITPNLSEAESATGIKIGDEASLKKAAGRLLDITGAHVAVITMGGKGMSYFSSDGEHGSVPSLAREVFDVTGAGDTAVSVFTLAYVSTGDLHASVTAANAAAGITVGKSGAAYVTPGELRSHFGAAGEEDSSRLKGRKELAKILSGLRARGRKIVFTNGCFDLFHAGHLRLLNDARRLGDVLVVAINSDDSVARLKGEGRPYVSESGRAALLSSLGCVDYVTVFGEDTPLRLIKELCPDVLVKGGDYKPGEVVGKEIVEEAGGEVKIIPLTPGLSTSSIARKIKTGLDKKGK